LEAPRGGAVRALLLENADHQVIAQQLVFPSHGQPSAVGAISARPLDQFRTQYAHWAGGFDDFGGKHAAISAVGIHRRQAIAARIPSHAAADDVMDDEISGLAVTRDDFRTRVESAGAES